MVVLNKIYTKTGDRGETALGDGTRVLKTSLRVDSYGNVDELNSVLGLAHHHSRSPLKDMIMAIQNDLFDLGADLCVPEVQGQESDHPPLRVVEDQVLRLENEIDRANRKLEPLRSFILPGGSLLASCLHQCRTVCRRAERQVVALSNEATVNPLAIQYLNRLSDWLFVMARVANDDGKTDVLWVPGANRKN